MSARAKAERRELAALPRVRTRCVALDPAAWGYENRAAMEAHLAELVDPSMNWPDQAPRVDDS